MWQIPWVWARVEDLAVYLDAPYSHFQFLCWKLCELLCSSVSSWWSLKNLSVLSKCASHSVTSLAVALPGTTCAFLPGKTFLPTALMLLTSQQRSLSHQLTTMSSVWMKPLLWLRACQTCALLVSWTRSTLIFEWILPPHPSLLSWSKKSLSSSLSVYNTLEEPNKE